ncbi:FAD binding domain-containing protein [Flavitalea sp.]|nr:xanthine dehydrogenase family protein subunit M [Flavitalea sp.]
MNNFTYRQVTMVEEAIDEKTGNTAFVAGGTNLLDLMKENIAKPDRLIDINHIHQLAGIVELEEGSIRLGATVTNADTAWHPVIESRLPLVSKAILSGASPQLRNMATNGGNLMQRTRCYNFYDKATPCNKREPGSGCSALYGYSRIHAILGASEHCIATHPSDFCVALAALDAVVEVKGSYGEREIPFEDFHRLPEDKPEIDNTLRPGEIITGIRVPPNSFCKHCSYLKIRDRTSFAFALVSVATAFEMDGETISESKDGIGRRCT